MKGKNGFSVSKKDLHTETPYVLLFFIQRVLFKTSLDFIDPLGLMSLAAFIAEKGYEPGVFTGTVTDGAALFDKEAARKKIAALGLYCDFENASTVENFSRYIKNRWRIPVFIGGPQAVALDRDFMASSCCDAIARGEGEHTLLELLEYFVKGKGRMEGIAGISYLDAETGMVSNADRPLIADLDALPFQQQSHSLTHRKKNFSVLTGRGCPFHCAFCYQGGATKSVRMRSVESVVSEIRQTLQRNPEARYVWFADDTFTLDPERIARFCDAMAELRTERDFVWFCEGHPATLVKWPHMVRQMVDAGLVRMQIGIETGSRQVIDLYRKQTTLEQIEDVVHMCWEAKVPQLCGNIIVGGARESPDTLEETWQYVEKLLSAAPGMLDVSLTIFMPFPCTAITKNPEQFDMRISDPEALTSVGDYAVVRTTAMGLDEITAARGSVSHKIFETMRRLLETGQIPRELILRHYQLSVDYGISSVWHAAVYTRQPFLHRRYMLLARSDAKTMEDIPEQELLSWRPLRVFSLWNGLAWSDEVPRISGHVLSPLEYELLLRCSGKLQLKEIISLIFEKFKDRVESEVEAEGLILKLLKEFEARHWLVFAPY